MKGLAGLARGFGRRRGWSVLLTTQQGAEYLGNRAQAAGIAAAASGRNGGGSGGGSSGGSGSKAPLQSARPGPSPPSRLDKLRERFRARARCNDASGAEMYLRQYIQEGGEPQHWMLPMLLNTYGKLRQADKAWAIYQQLLKQQGQQPGDSTQQAQQGQQPAGSLEPASAAAPLAAPRETDMPAAGDDGSVESGGAEGGAAWQARLAARQGLLAAEAERLVRELALGAFPLSDYAYSTIITALSRAEHPPYDLPPRYAAMAAEAFREMRQRGLQPNVVVWHSLLACQAKAALPDEAFATYRAMLAAGVPPTPHTYSMLVSACGRARQPQRAADVVERLMPQAGVAPQLPVWNALLGAYGRAGSVDAAYEAWVRMLDSGATPDDLTERALALAFASHPALAADVVAEARQIRQSRSAAGEGPAAAEAEPGGTGEGEEDGGEEEGTPGDEQAAAAGAESGAKGMRAPYRLQRHRQGSLPIDQPSSGQRSHTPLAQLLEVVRGRGSSGGVGVGAEAEQRGLQVRQLLLLDLHGSSVAAARMVLLRRLETLVLQVPELEAEVGRMEAEWRWQREQQRERRSQQRQREAERQALQRQQQDVADELIATLSSESSSSSGQPGSGGGGSGSGRRRRRGGKRASQAAAEQAAPEQAAPEQAAVQALHAAERWPELGRAWEAPAGPAGSAQPGSGAAAGTGPGGAGDGQPPAPSEGPPGRQARFLAPSLCVITGAGRHSRGSGVLKGAVLQLLQQQGLPTVEDPANEGVVFVPWEPLLSYLQQQRQAMHTDHFLSAARARYLYVAAGAAGILAAANLLPRLAPWMA